MLLLHGGMSPIPKTPVDLHIRFYHKGTDDKAVGKGHVKCLLHLVSRNGSVTIQADPESAVGKFGLLVLSGSSLNFEPTQCQATISRDP